jgi:hypothetical protein
MQRRTKRRQLAALGRPPFEPTDQHRQLVRLMSFNDRPIDAIAGQLEITPLEVRYHFAVELNLGRDQLLAAAAGTMVDLARQRDDLGVAFKAAELMLKTRLKAWRVPAEETADSLDPLVEIENLSLDQVEERLARIRRDREGPAGAGETPAHAADESG